MPFGLTLLATLALGLMALALLFTAYAAWGARGAQRALVPLQGALDLDTPLFVVMPARNEAPEIAGVLDALLASDAGPHLSIVVVDDGSTDDTAALIDARAARDPRIVRVPAPEKPAGLFGKPAALAAGCAFLKERAGAAPDAPVLFLDADVVLARGAIAALYNAMGRTAAHFITVAPQLRYGSAAEALLVPSFVAGVGARYDVRRVHDENDATAFLNGQVIMTRLSHLTAVGGWAAVSGRVLEDVALGHVAKAAGLTLRVADGRAHFSTRMYDGFAEIYRGFKKNAVAVHQGPFRAIAAAAFGLVASWLWVDATIMALAATLGGAPALVLALVGAGAAGVVMMQARVRRALDAPAWTALFIPLSYVFYAVLHVDAAFTAWRGGDVEWAGRRYVSGREP